MAQYSRLSLVAVALSLAGSGCGGQSSNEPGTDSDMETAPPGAALVSCGAEPRWTFQTGGYGERRSFVAFSPDGTRVAWGTGFYDPVRLELDAASGAELARFEPDVEQPPRNELVGLDASWQVELLGSAELWINEPATGISRTCAGTGAYLDSSPGALLSQDGSRVFRGSCATQEMGWDVLSAASGQLEQRITLGATCGPVSGTERGGDALLTGDVAVAFLPKGQSTPSVTTTHEHAATQNLRGIVGAALDPERTRAVTIAMDGSVQTYDLPALLIHETSLSARVFEINDNIYAPTFPTAPVTFSSDGGTLAFVTSDGDLVLRASDTLSEVSRIPQIAPKPNYPAPGSITALAFSPDDLTLLVASDGSLRAYPCSPRDP